MRPKCTGLSDSPIVLANLTYLSRGALVDLTRNAHARYFAERETDVLAVWDSPRQREAYTWLSVELANLRAAFRWSFLARRRPRL